MPDDLPELLGTLGLIKYIDVFEEQEVIWNMGWVAEQQTNPSLGPLAPHHPLTVTLPVLLKL